MSNFNDALEDDMILTGGHFTLTPDGSSLNAGTIESFRCSAKLYATEREKFRNLGFGILINDIGDVCSLSGCQTRSVPPRTQFAFPDSYLTILNDFAIGKEEVNIFWEKHIRNRAKKQLHSQIALKNPHIVYREQEGYIYHSAGEGIEILLTRYNKSDVKGTPACPLIMSAYSLEHKRLGYKSSLNFYYVGEDNYMNVANHFVIEKGKFLAARFNGELGNIKNVYLFNDRVMKNF